MMNEHCLINYCNLGPEMVSKVLNIDSIRDTLYNYYTVYIAGNLCM